MVFKITAKSIFFFIFFISGFVFAQPKNHVWHDTIRQLHYKPEGEHFKLVQGSRKFNRALYGTNTGFRVETGDLPEFAMYLPGMGGNFKLGISDTATSKWLTTCDSIVTKYIPGSMIYEIRDALLGAGVLKIEVVALADSEGFILKMDTESLVNPIDLIWAFGGASGKKFHRDGDIGADPESVFYLQPEYCINNTYLIEESHFTLAFGSETNKKKTGNNRRIVACFPDSEVKLVSANHQQNPGVLYASKVDSLPVISGKLNLKAKQSRYWCFENTEANSFKSQSQIEKDYHKAIDKIENLRTRVTVETPDEYINTLGGALAVAADAIWEDPAFLHGSVAWRMHLNAWRGAYVADPLGWKDRAGTHFKSYGKSQVLEPETGPVVLDSSRNFARQKEVLGTAMFSRGYISRRPNNNTIAHHYDMNSVFINQVLRHYLWSGDLEFIKEMWPVITRHLAWEKRNFDVDNDGLYDAYACIWASDALQYSGGGVTYASAYNYSANKIAAQIATILGEDATAYQTEANHIKNAIQKELWINEKGVFAEFKDLLGNKLLHETPGLWTIYHSLDEGIADGFEAQQMLNYVDNEIPHIPVITNNSEADGLFLLSTTNWQPYTWSVNNVALAENLHASLAYWQGGNSEKAFQLWKSALVESMYYGASPGGFQQLSFYDAIRGELYRDFADSIGMAARSLVEGLFGIVPNAIENTLTIKPGFPADWDFADLDIPNIAISYKRDQGASWYNITPKFETKLNLKLVVKPEFASIKAVTLNGKKVSYEIVNDAVGAPQVIIESPYSEHYIIGIVYGDERIENVGIQTDTYTGKLLNINTGKAKILQIKDPQNVLSESEIQSNELNNTVVKKTGHSMFFVKLQQNDLIWWEPIYLNINKPFELSSVENESDNIILSLKPSNAKETIQSLKLNGKTISDFKISEGKNYRISIPKTYAIPGTNQLEITTKTAQTSVTFQNWDIEFQSDLKFQTIPLEAHFNAKVTEVFQQEYLSPRPISPTLQLPTQGIGNWCYPYIKPDLDDSGLREKASDGSIKTPQHIPLQTPQNSETNNIAFTSMWDNYPEAITISLDGNASHAYLLMAGTTNPMQSQMVNGIVKVGYADGAYEVLELKNPENWWPIEQNYYTDGSAFTTGAVKPPRLYLKSGKFLTDFKDYIPIKGFSDFAIDGGAATLLDLPLNPNKTLKSLEVKTIANDVVIGLMSATLVRN
ncbi:DUF4450 domain-containing protein [Formosa haliotis]|uniref:DUF4450 domain-containing protein n=1 Tax=Formosa haliotis TaxID=1555194 RepID=UPI000826302B|nr:DUF4450 domain-containing protein [Formosa haliotis]